MKDRAKMMEGEMEATEPNKPDVLIKEEMPNNQLKNQVTYDYRTPTQSPYMGGPSSQYQYVGGPYFQSQYMGGKLGQLQYIGGKLEQPPYKGGQPEKPPYMGGPSSFSISPQPGYGPTSVPMTYGYHQYPHTN